MANLSDLLVAVAPDGWVTVAGPAGTRVHMRLERDEAGEFVVTNVLVHGERITSEVLRGVQPARAEALARLGDAAKTVADGGGTIVPVTAPLMLADFLSVARPDDEVTLAALRAREPASDSPGPVRARLGRPDGSDPDVFYRAVAAAYREYATQTKAAAARIADEASVPVTTAHRWVREARRRGFLPAGQRGKTG